MYCKDAGVIMMNNSFQIPNNDHSFVPAPTQNNISLPAFNGILSVIAICVWK